MGQDESPGSNPTQANTQANGRARRLLLEVCVETVEDGLTAARHGADRLELCCGLETGGLTPSVGLFRETRAAVGPQMPINVLICPRVGDFVWSHGVGAVMRRDLDTLLAEGADGAAVSALRPDGSIDRDLSGTLGRIIGVGSRAVFHRAFDHVEEKPGEFDQSLEDLVGLGLSRVLTTGRRAVAAWGVANLARWVVQARGRIEIGAAGGIGPANLAGIVRQSGCCRVHASRRARSEPPLLVRAARVARVPLAVGEAQSLSSGPRGVDPGVVARCRVMLDERAGELND